MAVSQGIVMACGEKEEAMDARNLQKKAATHRARCKQCKEQA